MKKTAGHMMGYMGLMDDDAKMLCKVLEISAAQALSLKKKIKMGHKLPSWAEYKIYKAGDALKSAMASTHSMRDHMPKITIAIKSGSSMGSPLPSNMSKQAMMGNSQFTQQMMKGSGLPGYSKGGPVKKDGYLTDKKGKPYARVHKGEKVVPKDEKTKKAWAKIASKRDPRLERAGVSGYNKPKRTPGHPTKSHIVVAKEGNQIRTIRFGQQGVKTNQTAGQREAFKSRHRKNIARGKMSAAYWADRAKWSPSKTKDKKNKKWVKGS